MAELPLLKGALDLLLLKTLSWGPLHGYAMASWLEQRSDGTLGVALLIAAAGTVAGLAAAAGATRILGAWLVEIQPFDPLTFICLSAGLLAVAARAARLDPLIALRAE